LENNITFCIAQGLEQVYPNEKLNLNQLFFEIKGSSLDKLPNQKRELSIELQANMELDKFSNNEKIILFNLFLKTNYSLG
jgi:hypothetical protein